MRLREEGKERSARLLVDEQIKCTLCTSPLKNHAMNLVSIISLIRKICPKLFDSRKFPGWIWQAISKT